ncbi:golgin subfamily A member 4-like [Plodia interpunctella]|uniref:golgin subfamily A member 4-like n=1 Tax=Plodia interpunctella TaxID=58824 RepID=UPI0023679F5B|nr:golgin subfamily A member 4-like [Plodia interpunctella]
MFKKLKDKLAEEVKSSPQRIQQFAQAAQAAVTSASSSISDITNNDLFSIGDNDGQQSKTLKSQTSGQQSTFQEVPLFQPSGSQSTTEDSSYSLDNMDNQRQRRLSNSSFASDVSFRLPSYESPSMYHLQSDIEISASEAEERGFSGGQVSLERVTKDQLYAAYRRTQERYTKYRTQYANLAHHYKLLERENAKARSVLVETQDKALRRISELREQCALEQSAKAHLEKALRVDIEERNMKIEALNTQITLLQDSKDESNKEQIVTIDDTNSNGSEQVAQLINLALDNEVKQVCEQAPNVELITLNNKIEKMEQLLTKYKESLKTTKEKNTQMAMELQKMTIELSSKNQEIEVLKATSAQLIEAKQQIHELNITNEELQNKINTYDFSKTKETSTLELDLQRAQEEIDELSRKIYIFTKREEENAISLAENKLSIHKELESKETEIKKLKDHLSAANTELQSINIIVTDYKTKLASLEEEKTKLTDNIKELATAKTKIKDLETQMQSLTQQLLIIEQSKVKCDEEYKCLQLQMKQETAEKLAMVDRNVYLENRNVQLTDEITRKGSQISKLEHEIQIFKTEKDNDLAEISEKGQILDEVQVWKAKYTNLESEIQEEREELVKLQSEIEKLLRNHELIQNQNSDLNVVVADLKSENIILRQKLALAKPALSELSNELKVLKNLILEVSSESKSLQTEMYHKIIPELLKKINFIIAFSKSHEEINLKYQNLVKDYSLLQDNLQKVLSKQDITNKNLLTLQIENDDLKGQIDQYKEIERNYVSSQNELKENINRQEIITKELHMLQEQNKSLIYRMQEYDTLQNNYEILQKELQEMREKQNELQKEYNEMQKENERLNYCLEELENLQTEYKKTQKKLSEVSSNHNASKEKLQFLQKEYDYKEEALNKISNDYERVKNELELTQKQIKNLEEQLQKYEAEFNVIKDSQEQDAKKLNESKEMTNNIRQECAEKEMRIADLVKKLEAIMQENISLKNQSESIKMNAIHLESEIEEVRKMHSVMESEKDRLNIIIKQLEINQQSAQTENKEVQVESVSSHNAPKNFSNEMESLIHNIDSLTSKNAEHEKEIASLKEINSQLSSNVFQNQKIEDKNVENNTEMYQTLNEECEHLRSENKRLKSDIEGLQIYLTKISKENGELNDRLRELIASSVNLPDKNEINVASPTELEKEINLEKLKIDDLLRENSLLIEENLELKDQIQSQNYAKTDSTMPIHNNNELESTNIKEKYDDLLNKKLKLEERVRDLEQINKSVNGNVQQIQDGNQKLRLANEKLERRLDEALVSLRHLHSLQENTELEYLRNILYEYLTGTGMHSITLAKVLAAVVKFDEKQTQAVLQKEKERQGVLHQLGLL